MPECRSILILWAITAAVVSAFLPPRQLQLKTTPSVVCMVAEKVEVCGFKDCKRAGGGPRLVKEIGQILEEKGMETAIVVEPCDCQGECGYGPNLLVDGKIVNDVKGREAILKALGIEE